VRTKKVFQQTAAVCAAVLLAVPASAQQAGSTPTPNDPARPQVQTFEMVLGRAIETAGRNFASRAVQMAPEISALAMSFAPGEAPVVNGVADHELGLYLFQVQVPGISMMTLQVMSLMLNRPQPVVPSTGAQPVAGRVTADGVIASDPMAPAPARPGPPRDLESEYRVEYVQLVKDALIDAILDNSGALPMTSNEYLLVVASGIDPVVPNALYRTPSRKLVLKAKASDLADFRQGKINREEARQRIQATRF
jgi:hypothetical protein